MRASRSHWTVTLSVGVGWLGVLLSGPPAALAMHEVDHRFTVEGFVCQADGQPASGVQIVAKDVRVSVVASALTDDRGYYRITLHLHNDNRGDPIVVTAREQEQRVTAQFDITDAHTERKTTVNFGTGCEAMADEPPVWVYWGAGVGALAVTVFVGAKLLRGQRRSHKGGKHKRR